MERADSELRLQLKEAGKQLSHPPEPVLELLHLLDQVEKLLSKVDQSPNASMQEALKPSVKALIKGSLLKHSNVDVKVAVASCISEITRITAPDAAYDDQEMRDVFELIVSSFENLSDKTSRSYSKRTSIIETVSKIRSCVIMLDLECDGLIVNMFEHFLKSVRDHHPESVFSSMMNIMVLVLQESDDISVDILKPLLASVKNDKGVLPVARKLGEGVLQKSADRLRPHLIQTLRTSGDSLDNYSQVLASICQGTTAVFEHNDENAPVQPQVDERRLAKESSDEAPKADEIKITTASSNKVNKVVIKYSEKPLLGEMDPTSHKSSKSGMNNGITFDENKEEASTDQDSSKKPKEAIKHPDSNPTSKEHPNDSPAEKLKRIESNPEKPSKKRVKKSETPMNSAKPSDSSHGEKKAKKPPNKERSKDADNYSPSETEEKTDNLIPASEATEEEVAKDNKPFLTKAPEAKSESNTKPRKRARKKAPATKQDKLPVPIVTLEDGEAGSGSDLKPLKTPSKKANTHGSGAKSAKQSGKGKKAGAGDSKAKKPKQQSDKKLEAEELEAKKQKSAGEEESKPLTVQKDDEDDSDSDNKPLIQSTNKKGNASSSTMPKSSPKKNKDGKKLESGKKAEELSLSEDDGTDTMLEGTLKQRVSTASKRKRATGKSKVTDTIKYDKSLIGSKVKVWWPVDQMYYEGVIAAYDSKKRTHQVSYLDGEVEILNLKKEKWEILQEFSAPEEVKAPEVQTVDVSPEIQTADGSPEIYKRKKAGTDSGPSPSQEKAKDSAKRAGGASKSARKVDKKSMDTEAEADADAGEGGMVKEDDEKKEASPDPNADGNGPKPDKLKSGAKSGKSGSKKRKRS